MDRFRANVYLNPEVRSRAKELMVDKVRANVYLDAEVRRRAKELADRMGLSFSAFVNIALYEYLKQSSVIELSKRR